MMIFDFHGLLLVPVCVHAPLPKQSLDSVTSDQVLDFLGGDGGDRSSIFF